MKKNKFLPYLLFGVPLLIGTYFVIKAIRGNKHQEEEDDQQDDAPPQKPTNGNTNVGYVNTDKLPFKKGMQSSYIGQIQLKLGITSDNQFGNGTLKAVKSFQKKNGLTADGVVGAKTWKALFGVDFPLSGTNDTSKVKGVFVKDTLITHDPNEPFVLGGKNW
jgi:hypothetical protein